MALQSSNILLAGDAFLSIRTNAAGYRAQAANALATMQAGSVSTDFIFRMLDQLSAAIASFTQWKAVSGLDAYATSQSYPTTMTTDCTACVTAAQAAIAWVVANFPMSTAYTLNADGSRSPRLFTSAQTAGLQTALANFVATIG